MRLFSESLLTEMSRLPGARHSFLKQIAGPEGQDLRELIEREAALAPEDARQRWSDLLGSLDNRRFFQGFAELSVIRRLRQAGWGLDALREPGPGLLTHGPAQRAFHTLVLGFIRQLRPVPDNELVQRLTRSLDRVGSRARIAVLIRRWLPHDFDPEPVRRAIDLWLAEVDRGGWDGRYAAYDDEHVSLEFALTDEQADEDQDIVAFTLGPFDAQRAIELLEQRIVYELDAHRMRAPSDRMPLLVAAVADQNWRISRSYLRELMLGKPRSISTTDGGPLELTYTDDYAPSLFRDPVYRQLSGVILMDRLVPDRFRGRAWLNPWAHSPLEPADLPMPSLAAARWEDGHPVLRWIPGEPS